MYDHFLIFYFTVPKCLSTHELVRVILLLEHLKFFKHASFVSQLEVYYKFDRVLTALTTSERHFLGDNCAETSLESRTE